MLVKHLRYDFACNHLNERELSDKEERLYNKRKGKAEFSLLTQPIGTQLTT